jgi:hypothetical protein
VIRVALDPGPVETAMVLYGHQPNPQGRKAPNGEILEELTALTCLAFPEQITIEMIASYGMAVGAEVFETCVWIGRFMSVQPTITDRVTRLQVKLHICKSPKANDSNIRQALIDRWGGDQVAIGRKKAPGPLYGFSGDVWAALAVAVTAAETTERYKAP